MAVRLVGREVDRAAYAWSEMDGFISLDRNSYSYSVARDTSGDGAIFVGSFGIARSGRVTSLKNMLTNVFGLDVLGWQFDAETSFVEPFIPVFGGLGATAISHDGNAIAGVGRNPIGLVEAFHVAFERAPTIADFDNLPPHTLARPLSAALPIARSGVVGEKLRVFATLVNPTEIDLVGCGVVLTGTVPVDFSYQISDPTDNGPIGTSDTPVDIPVGAAQSFVLSFTRTAAFPAAVLPILFDCGNARPADVIQGLNNVVLSASDVPVADVIALARTVTSDGRVALVNQVGEFVVGAINIGPDERLTVSTVSAEPPFIIGGDDEFTTLVCQSNPATGDCIGAAAESVDVDMNTEDVMTFRVTVGIPPSSWLYPDYQHNRLQVLFTDQNGNLRGATSVAVETDFSSL
jgi:hypothetical protein